MTLRYFLTLKMNFFILKAFLLNFLDSSLHIWVSIWMWIGEEHIVTVFEIFIHSKLKWCLRTVWVIRKHHFSRYTLPFLSIKWDFVLHQILVFLHCDFQIHRSILTSHIFSRITQVLKIELQFSLWILTVCWNTGDSEKEGYSTIINRRYIWVCVWL